jgi:hypothetical protein
MSTARSIVPEVEPDVGFALRHAQTADLLEPAELIRRLEGIVFSDLGPAATAVHDGRHVRNVDDDPRREDLLVGFQLVRGDGRFSQEQYTIA